MRLKCRREGENIDSASCNVTSEGIWRSESILKEIHVVIIDLKGFCYEVYYYTGAGEGEDSKEWGFNRETTWSILQLKPYIQPERKIIYSFPVIMICSAKIAASPKKHSKLKNGLTFERLSDSRPG